MRRILALLLLVAGISCVYPLVAHADEGSPVPPSTMPVSALLIGVNRDDVTFRLWIDAQGLLDRSQNARMGVAEVLEEALAPYATCEIDFGSVYAGGSRHMAYDIAAFVAGTLITQFPEFNADRKLAPSAASIDSLAFGEVKLILLFNEDCAPASDLATPGVMPSPAVVTPAD